MKKVGIVGQVKLANGWPTKIIEVKRVYLLDETKGN